MDNGRWLAVEDGPCFPSICNQPLEIDNTCDIAEHVGYWHNAATGQCEPYPGGCPMNDNAFLSLDACVESCQDKVSLAAVVEWSSCEGLGQQISEAGDEGTFSREGNVISKELFWGCGCATRSEFVMAYEPSSPLHLRLCHDEAADPCEAGCMDQVGFNVSEAFAAANTDDFVFVD
jgi:hypothetical protein